MEKLRNIKEASSLSQGERGCVMTRAGSCGSPVPLARCQLSGDQHSSEDMVGQGGPHRPPSHLPPLRGGLECLDILRPGKDWLLCPSFSGILLPHPRWLLGSPR